METNKIHLKPLNVSTPTHFAMGSTQMNTQHQVNGSLRGSMTPISGRSSFKMGSGNKMAYPANLGKNLGGGFNSMNNTMTGFQTNGISGQKILSPFKQQFLKLDLDQSKFNQTTNGLNTNTAITQKNNDEPKKFNLIGHKLMGAKPMMLPDVKTL